MLEIEAKIAVMAEVLRLVSKVWNELCTVVDVWHIVLSPKLTLLIAHHIEADFETLADPLNSWCSGAYTIATTPPVVDPPAPEITPPDYILAYWTATNQTRKYIPE